MFGLTDQDLDFILSETKSFKTIEAVGLFGSRAIGLYSDSSDIDIVLYGKDIDCWVLEQITERLEHHSPFPFYVDVVHYDAIKDPIFKSQVDAHVVYLTQP